jgi:antitoxin ChpS
MTTVVVRQLGGSNIVSIPKQIGKALGLHAGSELDLSIVENRIVLAPVVAKTSLEELLDGSPRENFQVTEEDREWIDAKPIGKES